MLFPWAIFDRSSYNLDISFREVSIFRIFLSKNVIYNENLNLTSVSFEINKFSRIQIISINQFDILESLLITLLNLSMINSILGSDTFDWIQLYILYIFEISFNRILYALLSFTKYGFFGKKDNLLGLVIIGAIMFHSL